jgi:restriction system protein
LDIILLKKSWSLGKY